MGARLLGAVMLGAVAARAASAQGIPPPTDSVAQQLPPVEVRASIVPSAASEVGGGVAGMQVLAGDAVRAGGPARVAEVLEREAGFTLHDDLGSPFERSLDARGFSVGPVAGAPQGLSVFVDGIRQNEPDAAQVNLELLPLAQAERIEILRGTASLLGPNSLGGAINVVTSRGTGPLGGRLGASGGSFGAASVEGALEGGGRAGALYLGGTLAREGGWRAATAGRTGNLLLNLTRASPDRRRGASLQGYWAGADARTAGSLPASLFDAAPASNFTPGDRDRLGLLQGALAAWLAGDAGRLDVTLYHRRSDAHRFNVNQAPDPDVQSDALGRVTGLRIDARRAFTLGRAVLAVRAGSEGTLARAALRITTVAPGDSTLTTDVASPGGDLSGYALTDLTLGALTLSAGARYDLVRLPFRDRLAPATDTTSTYRHLSPRAGVRLDLSPGASLYAGVGRGFRAPALVELTCADPGAPCPLPFALGDDPPLAPVVATTLELGARWALPPAALDLAAYRTVVRDDIYFVASEASLIGGYFRNLASTRRLGLEATARLPLTRAAALSVGYTFTRATFETAADLFSAREAAGATNAVLPGDRMPLVPAHRVSVAATTRLGRAGTLDADARYTGPRWLRGDEANDTAPLAGYVTVGLGTSWRVGPWTLDGRLDNALDAHYATFGTYNENRETGAIERFRTPGAPRRVTVSVEREFGGR